MYCKLKDAQKVSSEITVEFGRLQGNHSLQVYATVWNACVVMILSVLFTEELERERTLNTALERDVANLEERKEYEKTLDQLRMKRPWLVCSSFLFGSGPHSVLHSSMPTSPPTSPCLSLSLPLSLNLTTSNYNSQASNQTIQHSQKKTQKKKKRTNLEFKWQEKK